MKSLWKNRRMSKDYQKEIISRLRTLALTVQCVMYFPIISVGQTAAIPIQQQTRGIHTKLCWSRTFHKAVIRSKPSFLLWHWLWGGKKKKNKSTKERPLWKIRRSSTNLPRILEPWWHSISLPISLQKDPHLAHTYCCF